MAGGSTGAAPAQVRGHAPAASPARPIDRASSEDLMSLAGDSGSVPMQVGGVVFLRTGEDWDPAHLLQAVAARIPAVPRLRQRLHRLPVGLGRPVWQDDPHFSSDRHLNHARCAGGRQGVLDLAADLLVMRLPSDRPLWTARVVTGFAPGEAAVVLVLHHVLADGVAALAILADLARPQAAAGAGGFPRPLPGARALLADNLRGRAAGVVALPSRLVRLVAAVAVLRTPTTRAAPTSLNRPTGPRRRVATVSCSLADALALARSQGATVNDLVLAVIAEALSGLAASRGEVLPDVVISVPVSARRTASSNDLGNRTGVMPVSVPATGARGDRLRSVAAVTRRAKSLPAAASAAVLGPWFRWLAGLGLFGWFTDRQRLVHTFATNLRGPTEPFRLGTLEVTGIVPLTVTTGNITAAFATFSYAGDLGITIIADPDTLGDLDQLHARVEAALAGFLAGDLTSGPPSGVPVDAGGGAHPS